MIWPFDRDPKPSLFEMAASAAREDWLSMETIRQQQTSTVDGVTTTIKTLGPRRFRIEVDGRIIDVEVPKGEPAKVSEWTRAEAS